MIVCEVSCPRKTFLEKEKIIVTSVNVLPDNKILTWSKSIKSVTFTDILNLAEVMAIIWENVVNLVGKGENAGKEYFLYLPQCFQHANF